VYHDVPGEGFNVDHVLIGPGGVYLIETKTFSKRPGDARIEYDGERVLIDGAAPDRDPIKQVQALRDHVGVILVQAVGRRPKIRPVVLFPGWYIDKQPRGVDVWFLTPLALPSLLDKEPVTLKPEEVSLFATALETYVRARLQDSAG
jgi:hypothetical protein